MPEFINTDHKRRGTAWKRTGIRRQGRSVTDQWDAFSKPIEPEVGTETITEKIEPVSSERRKTPVSKGRRRRRTDVASLDGLTCDNGLMDFQLSEDRKASSTKNASISCASREAAVASSTGYQEKQSGNATLRAKEETTSLASSSTASHRVYPGFEDAGNNPLSLPGPQKTVGTHSSVSDSPYTDPSTERRNKPQNEAKLSPSESLETLTVSPERVSHQPLSRSKLASNQIISEALCMSTIAEGKVLHSASGAPDATCNFIKPAQNDSPTKVKNNAGVSGVDLVIEKALGMKKSMGPVPIRSERKHGLKGTNAMQGDSDYKSTMVSADRIPTIKERIDSLARARQGPLLKQSTTLKSYSVSKQRIQKPQALDVLVSKPPSSLKPAGKPLTEEESVVSRTANPSPSDLLEVPVPRVRLLQPKKGSFSKKSEEKSAPEPVPSLDREDLDTGTKQGVLKPRAERLPPKTKATIKTVEVEKPIVSFAENCAASGFSRGKRSKEGKIAASDKAARLVKVATPISTSRTSLDESKVSCGPSGGMKGLLHRLKTKCGGKRKRTEATNLLNKSDEEPSRSSKRKRTVIADFSKQLCMNKKRPVDGKLTRNQDPQMKPGESSNTMHPSDICSATISQFESTSLCYGYLDRHDFCQLESLPSIPLSTVDDEFDAREVKSGCLGSGKQWRSIGPKALEISWHTTAGKEELLWEIALVQYINKRLPKTMLLHPVMVCQYNEHVALRVEPREKVTVLGTVEDLFRLHFVYGLGMIPESVLGWLVVETVKRVSPLHKLGIAHNSLGMSSLLVVHGEESNEWMLYLTGLGSNATIRKSGDLRSHFAHDMFSIAATTWSLLTGGNQFVFNKINGKVKIESFNMVTNNHWLRGKDGWKELFLDLVNPSLDAHGLHMIPTTTVRMMEGIVSMGRSNAEIETPVAVASFFERLLTFQSECTDLMRQCVKISVDLGSNPEELVQKLLCDELPRQTIFLGSTGRKSLTSEKSGPSRSRVLDVEVLKLGPPDSGKTGPSPSRFLDVEVLKFGPAEDLSALESILYSPAKRKELMPGQSRNKSIRRLKFEAEHEEDTHPPTDKPQPTLSGCNTNDFSKKKEPSEMQTNQNVHVAIKPESRSMDSVGRIQTKGFPTDESNEKAPTGQDCGHADRKGTAKSSNAPLRKRSRGSPVRVSVLETLITSAEDLAPKNCQKKTKRRKSRREQDGGKPAISVVCRRSNRMKLTCGVDGCTRSFESGLMWVLMYNLEDRSKGMDPHIPSVPVNHKKHLLCQGCRPCKASSIFLPSEIWKKKERSQIKKFDKYLYYLCSKGDYESACDCNPKETESTTI